MRRLLFASAMMIALTGCHGRSAGTGDAASAAESRTDCGSVKPESAPPGSPADDILGVRPGTPASVARLIVTCANKKFDVTPHTTDRPGYIANIPEILNGKQPADGFEARVPTEGASTPSDDDVQVIFAGLPGAERVVAVYRTVWPDHKNPPSLDTLTATLVKKYGPPTHTEKYQISWIYNPSGSPIAESDPTYSVCVDGNLNGGLSPDCGTTIVAQINWDDDGQSKSVKWFSVHTVNQAQAADSVDRETSAINTLNTPSGAAPKL